MGSVVLVGALSAFGFLCAMWVAVGWLLPGGKHGLAVCVCTPGLKELSTVHRWRWLRSLGFIRCPVIVVAKGLSDPEILELFRAAKGMEICTQEEFYTHLDSESKRFD